MPPVLTHRENSSGPIAPIPTVHTRCSGWSCLTDAEQFGILFSIIVTTAILGIVYICFLRSRKADREVALELFHVRYPRASRRPRAVSVPVMLPPPPAYQPAQVSYAYRTYAPPGHVVAPPGAPVQPYAIPGGGTASVMYSPVDGSQRPPAFHAPGPPPVPYSAQQPAQQVPMAGVPLDAYNNLPQPGGYTQTGGPRHSRAEAPPLGDTPEDPTVVLEPAAALIAQSALSLDEVSTLINPPPGGLDGRRGHRDPSAEESSSSLDFGKINYWRQIAENPALLDDIDIDIAIAITTTSTTSTTTAQPQHRSHWKRKTKVHTMGLVDYDSDSGSDSDSVAPQPAPKPKTTTTTSTGAAPAPTETGAGAAGKKKPFQKLIDRSDPKKIKVNLPDAKRGAGDEPPPAKRARTAGGGAFGGFNSMLPAPKNPPKGASAGSAAAGGWAVGKAVGAGLKTGSERGFVRDGGEVGGGGGGDRGPEIPEGMKREEDVKLVGKPLMFRPLSVARKAATKKGAAKKGAAAPAKTGAPPPPAPTPAQEAPKPAPEPQEELSLFSLPSAEDDAPTADPHPHVPYTPLPEADPSPLPDWTTIPQQQEQQTVSSLAQDLNLSRTAHRDLFGRGAAPDADFLTFDLSKEYSRNEVLRQSGELAQPQRPARAAIQGGGKHSLKQLVNAVAGQREVLEEGFAKGKEKRRDAGGRYGWR